MRTRHLIVAILVTTVFGAWLAAAAPTRADPTVTNFTGTGLNSPRDIAAGADGAMWFTNGAANVIGRIGMTGGITTYTDGSVKGPYDIARGPDGNVWFTNRGGNSIGRISPSGTITNYTSATINAPTSITAGPDGAMWFINYNTQHIGRVAMDGSVSDFAGASAGLPQDIAGGPDGALWFTIGGSNDGVARITTSGAVTEFHNAAISSPASIAAGPDGAVWFMITGFGGSMGRITTSGVFTQYHWGVGGYSFAVGPDAAFWFGDSDSIHRVTLGGAVSTYPDPTVSTAFDIAAGPDGAMWFTNSSTNSIGRVAVPTSTDTSAPVITLPPNFSLDAMSPIGAFVTYTVSANDDVDGAVTPTCTPASGSMFPVGPTTVLCSASDLAGHTSTASFIVTVHGAYDQLGALYSKVIAVKGQKDIADKLHHAQQEVAAGHKAPACKDLSDFINTVKSRAGKAIPSATATQWMADATRIRAVIGC